MIVIFHSQDGQNHCDDGFAAAWVFWKAFPDATFIPGVYGAEPPIEHCRGKAVTLVDFSYKREPMKRLAEAASRVTILDHHRTAEEELGGSLEPAAEVELSNGKVAYVDAKDLSLVHGYSWSEAARGGAVAYAGGGRENSKTVYMHHVIRGSNAPTDHRNRNSLDNRRCNLRDANKQQNAANMIRRPGKAKGVTKRAEGRWIAQIMVNGKQNYLGTYPTEQEAAAAYEGAAAMYFGDYARNSSTDDPWPPTTEIIFDMERSGATITWDWCFPGQPRPPLIERIEDNDLWRMPRRYDDSVLVQAALRSHPQDFDVWDELMALPIEFLEHEGKAIRRFIDAKITELKRTWWWDDVGGVRMPVCNAPWFLASDLAGQLAEENDGVAAIYFDQPTRRVYSLRARGDHDVSEIAKTMGGGGHKGAAGFEVPKP